MACSAAAVPSLHAQGLARVEILGRSDRSGGADIQPGVTVLRAADLSRAGVTTAEQALRRIVANQSAQGLSQGVGEFTGSVTEADLRGLGPDKTLVLVNGRRVANHAYDGGAVDLNSIPISAVDRIEVTREGASALYGSGAIGGVVNFVLRNDVRGVELAVEGEQPGHTGGATRRASLTAGFGEIGSQGFNAFMAIDLRHQNALAGKDRSFSKSGIRRPSDGSVLSSRTQGTSFPGDLDGYEPSFQAGCAPPRSVPDPQPDPDSDSEEETCRYDYMRDVDLIPRNRQATLLGHATFALGDKHHGTIEWLRAENKTWNRQTPTPTSMVLPDTSPYWIAGRPSTDFGELGQGGVANWLTVPAGRRSHETRALAQRVVLTLQGAGGGLTYDAAIGHARNTVTDVLRKGHIDFDKVQQAVLDGRVNPFGAQSAAGLAAIQASQLVGRLLRGRGEVTTFDARVGKELWPLAGGALAVALRFEYQRQKFNYDLAPLAARTADPELEFATDVRGVQQVRALIFETSAPLSPTLTLDLAARHERNSDGGRVNSRKFGVRWQAARGLLMRAALSADYRTPTLYEIHAPRLLTQSGTEHDDPLLCQDGVAVDGAPAELVCGRPVLQRIGGPVSSGSRASALRPERSQHATLGIVFEPTKHVVLGVDLWHLRLRDVIDSLSEQAVFNHPGRHASRIVRCSRLSASERAGIEGCLNAAGVDTIAFIDTPIENLGRLQAQGIDLSLAVTSGPTPAGEFSLGFEGSHIARYDFQQERGGAFIKNAGRFAEDMPIFRWQHLLQLNWQQGPWIAGVSQRFKSSYRDQDDSRTVASYSLIDLSLVYTGVPNLTLTAGLKNLFDRQPPYSRQDETLQVNYDPRATDPLGRAFAIRAAYQWR